YSDLVVHRLRPRVQIGVHVALLAISLVVLPIVPGAQWKPTGFENPSWLILSLLAATIGLPYFLLSTTSPLVQAWLARARPGSSPYRLFALSNLASMLALIGYPFMLEPWTPTREQAIGWSFGYSLFVVLCIASGWRSLRAQPAPQGAADVQNDVPAVADSLPNDARFADPPLDDAPPTRARQVLWCALAATGSILLLCVS